MFVTVCQTTQMLVGVLLQLSSLILLNQGKGGYRADLVVDLFLKIDRCYNNVWVNGRSKHLPLVILYVVIIVQGNLQPSCPLGRRCDTSQQDIACAFCIYGSYMLLFLHFFYSKYCNESAQGHLKKKE